MARKTPLSGKELRGYTRLVADATLGITDLVEAMHLRILYPPFLPATPVQDIIAGVSRFNYKSIRFFTKAASGGLDRALSVLPASDEEIPTTLKKEALIAALNGVIGDHLEDSKNPLALEMKFRFQGKPLALDAKDLKMVYPKVTGKILLLVHGSSMNDLQWCRHGHDHGEALAKELDYTPVYLHYNSGRHISTNGQDLNKLLEQLLQHWPVPVENLQILAHSMGGLVSRSAIHYGTAEKKNWVKALRKIVFLGTPHHGAPLERVGNYIDLLLEATPYVKPFARLGKIRSAGITDLRYGNLMDEDWEGIDRFAWRRDKRFSVPIPKGIAAYNIAANLEAEGGRGPKRLVGDGLVGLDSALGRHKEPAKDLNFPEAHNWISYESNHLDLLNKEEVFDCLQECFQ